MTAARLCRWHRCALLVGLAAGALGVSCREPGDRASAEISGESLPSAGGRSTVPAPDAANAARGADSPTLVPLQDLETAEILKINEIWTGDLDQLGDRRFLRALVPYSRVLYYLDGAEQRGAAYEALREFEKVLQTKLPRGEVKTKIVIIPTSRERLLPALAAGYGDLAIGAFNVTESRQKVVDFSEPIVAVVRDIVVTGPGAPSLKSLDDLSGHEVHVRPTSSYAESLGKLNQRLAREGKPPVRVRPVDDTLEDEDVLQMVDAGILPITVSKDLGAAFWAKVYDRLTVRSDLVLRDDGVTAWALRKHTPKLLHEVNAFVRGHRQGTLFGNMMLSRYLGSPARLTNPAGQQEMERFRNVVEHLKANAKQYDFDWLLLGALAYQESRLDQSVRSSAGAIGVMQIKPDIAAYMGVTGIERVDRNILAGTKYLRFVVDRYYANQPMDRLNRGLFALASYNAGPARIAKLRKKASTAGLDPNLWFRNVELIAARDIGRETVDYVSNIYKYYIAYKAIAARLEERDKALAEGAS
jgi:membrane-bound lytic murein transglycosylase MltF